MQSKLTNKPKQTRLRRQLFRILNIYIIIIAVLLLVIIMLAICNYRLKKRLCHCQDNYANAEQRAEDLQQTLKSETSKTADAANAMTKESQTDDDRKQFIEMDSAIEKEKLFLNPDFSREDICKLTKFSKERIGQLIKKHSGYSNLQLYISHKRITYAISLMEEHPNYSIEAIAQECGIGNLSTFYRTFKNEFGNSPAEYREHLKNKGK